MSDLDAAIEEAIRATGHERYRWLCSEANELPPPNDPATWRRFILEGGWRAGARADEAEVERIDSGLGWVPPLGPCGGC